MISTPKPTNRSKQINLFLLLLAIHTSMVSCDCNPKSPTSTQDDPNNSGGSTGSSGTSSGGGSSGTGTSSNGGSSSTGTSSSGGSSGTSTPPTPVTTITDDMIAAATFDGLKEVLTKMKNNEAVDLKQEVNLEFRQKALVIVNKKTPLGLIIDLLINLTNQGSGLDINKVREERIKIMDLLIARTDDSSQALKELKFGPSKLSVTYAAVNQSNTEVLKALLKYKDKLDLTEEHTFSSGIKKTLAQFAATKPEAVKELLRNVGVPGL